MLSSPYPGEIKTTPALAFEATIVKFLGRPIEEGIEAPFDFNDLLKEEFQHGQITYKKTFGNVYFLSLHGPRSISIIQTGPVPFAAWNPVKHSKVKLTTHKDYIQLEEECSPEKADFKKTGNALKIKSIPEFPVLDMLGSPIVIWSADESVVAVNNSDIIKTEEKSINNKREFLALVIKPAFSIRLVALPALEHAPSIGLPWIDYVLTNRKASKFVLQIPKNSTSNTIFQKAQDEINEKRVVTIKQIDWAGNKFEEMVMAYPQRLPDNWGFSLYGKLSELEFESAKASFAIGSKGIELKAPSDITLHGIEKMTSKNEVLTLMSQDVISDFKVNAKSIFINGKLEYKYLDEYKELIVILSFYITIISLIIAIVK